MRLYLCEKPSQARDIASVLGLKTKTATHLVTQDGNVTWAFGHLLELGEPEEYGDQYRAWSWESLPILPSEWKIQVARGKTAQVKAIKDLLKNASEVVIATDADREGEMIAREILEHCRYRGKIARLWLSALDPESIRKALQKLRRDEETKPLYYAAMARSRGDWLVGLNMTRALTVRCRPPSEKGVVSVGRVQTPTLALVVRRDREIANFKSRDYFEVVAHVATKDTQTKDCTVQLRHAPDGEKRIFDRAVAEGIVAKATGHTGPLKVEKEQKRQAPPKLFSLAGLQMRCSALWGWSADKTLDVAQALYETHKATTYPRSDCEYLPEEQEADIPVIVANLAGVEGVYGRRIENPIIRKTVFNTAKITAHHAIIPTKVKPDLAAMSADERRAYVLIAKSYLACLLPDYEYEQTRIVLEAAGVEFVATGNVPQKLGWKVIYSQEKEDPSKAVALPSIANGTPGTVTRCELETKQTKPPAYYTEGTLIADMKAIAKFVQDPEKKARLKETSGIGTEATRASIIKGLRQKDFLKASGKKILSTEKGQSLIALLEKHLPALADPGETAVWEEGMESIVAGKGSTEQFLAGIGGRVQEYLATLGKVTQAAPSSVSSQAAPRAQAVSEAKPTSVLCPKSGQPVLDGGNRWIFDGYDGFFMKDVCGRKMSAEDYVRIFQSKEPVPFDGFTSKTGKAFKTGLRYNPRRKWKGRPAPGVEFVFE